MRIQMQETITGEQYKSSCGMYLQRERESKTPNGNSIGGCWVLRSAEGVMLDFDQYRNDIASRHNLDLYYEFAQ